jgi:hypothetical protein
VWRFQPLLDTLTHSCSRSDLDNVLHSMGFVCPNDRISPRFFVAPAKDRILYKPGNLTQTLRVWAPECTSQMLLDEYERYSGSHPYKLVSIPTRKGADGQLTVKIQAWWLPADDLAMLHATSFSMAIMSTLTTILCSFLGISCGRWVSPC